MNTSPHLQNHVAPWRIYTLAVVILLVFLLFLVRMITLQVLQHQEWMAAASDNSTETFSIPAPRGIIYDRNGVVLARNLASYNVVVTAALLPEDPTAMQAIVRQLSGLIDVPVSQGAISPEDPYVPCTSDHGILQIIEYGQESYPYSPVKIKCDISEELARVLQEKAVDWPGITIEIQPIRDYPTGDITATFVGFLGPIPAASEDFYKSLGLVPNRDKVGYAGLEMEYQSILSGVNGTRTSEIDVAGQVVRDDIEPQVPPVPGYSLQLTIDTRLQQAADAIMREELRSWNAVVQEVKKMSQGVVIAMNPRTGEILAMVSYPSYENNRMARFIPSYYYEQLVKDATKPLINHAVGDVVPVGSVFKIVTGTGALNEGVVTPDQIIETPGKLDLTEKFFANDPGSPRPFVDWIYNNGANPGGFGKLDFLHGIAFSSNVYFYKLGGGYKDEVPGGGLGICRLKSYAEAMGYGPAPGVGLPEEQKGLIPDPQWKRINQAESWSTGDTYISSVGQGSVLATPLQVLMSVSTLANDGKLMQPTLIKEVVDGEGNPVPVYRDAEGNLTTDASRGVEQISPFTPTQKWDITTDNKIQAFGETTIRGCEPIQGETKNVQPWVIEKLKEGMRLAVTEGTLGALSKGAVGFDQLEAKGIPAAGKTGTAEYCDKYAKANNLCDPGRWPSHAWTFAFAPYNDPEIAVVAFVYNGGEGASVAGPIVRQVIQAYFELKAGDAAQQSP